MKVLGINDICKWCQIISGGRRYTCQIKMINNELCFWFKKEWHSVAKYISDTAEVLVREDNKNISIAFNDYKFW